MKIFSSIFAGLLLIMTVAAGCSKNGDASKNTADAQEDNKPQTQFNPVTEPAEQNYDTLAAKSYPVRSVKNPFVTLETDYGKLVLELYRDVAPAHADSFLARTKEGFYDGTIFHRIVKNFMIQGGDPQGTGFGNAGYFLKAEFSDLPHQEGTLSMARGRDPNSASSQFFICLARNRLTASLDGQYTVFGQLIRGFDVLQKLGNTECVASPNNPREVSKPAEDVYLRRAYVSDFDGNELEANE